VKPLRDSHARRGERRATADLLQRVLPAVGLDVSITTSVPRSARRRPSLSIANVLPTPGAAPSTHARCHARGWCSSQSLPAPMITDAVVTYRRRPCRSRRTPYRSGTRPCSSTIPWVGADTRTSREADAQPRRLAYRAHCAGPDRPAGRARSDNLRRGNRLLSAGPHRASGCAARRYRSTAHAELLRRYDHCRFFVLTTDHADSADAQKSHPFYRAMGLIHMRSREWRRSAAGAPLRQ